VAAALLVLLGATGFAVAATARGVGNLCGHAVEVP